MTAQTKSRKGLIFIVVLLALLLLAFFVGVPLLEKRIAARFVAEWQNVSIANYQIEDARASLFSRSLTTGKVGYSAPAIGDFPGYTLSCASSETTGMDWGTLLGYYPEISSFPYAKMADCQMTIDGAPVTTIKEISVSDMRYRYKEMLDFSRNHKIQTDISGIDADYMAALVAAMKDSTIGNVTIKGLDITYVAFSFTMDHAEVNNLDYMRGHGKATANNMKLMALGQKLFSLDEMSVDSQEWSYAVGILKKMTNDPTMANTSADEILGIYAEYPFEIRNFKMKGLAVNGSSLLTGSSENIFNSKEIGLNLRVDKDVTAGFTVEGLDLNLGALKQIPAVQEVVAFYNKPFQLDSTFELKMENFAEPAAISFAASLNEKNLGSAKAAASLGLLDPELSFDGDNLGVKTAEFVMTDTGMMDLAWRIAAGSRTTPEAIKAETLKELDEEMGKSASPVSVKARQAMRDFLEKGGQFSLKINLPQLMSFDDLTESFKSEVPQGVEVNWAPLKK